MTVRVLTVCVTRVEHVVLPLQILVSLPLIVLWEGGVVPSNPAVDCTVGGWCCTIKSCRWLHCGRVVLYPQILPLIALWEGGVVPANPAVDCTVGGWCCTSKSCRWLHCGRVVLYQQILHLELLCVQVKSTALGVAETLTPVLKVSQTVWLMHNTSQALSWGERQFWNSDLLLHNLTTWSNKHWIISSYVQILSLSPFSLPTFLHRTLSSVRVEWSLQRSLWRLETILYTTAPHGVGKPLTLTKFG